MNKSAVRFSVLFEEPFWVGLYEREADGRYEVCKITFGAEPKSYEVNAFLLKHWRRLRFSPSMEVGVCATKRVNPKRMQRDVNKQLQTTGIGTKAQQALKNQQEQGKQARKKRSREERKQEERRQFELHQEKRKEKHKGH